MRNFSRPSSCTSFSCSGADVRLQHRLLADLQDVLLHLLLRLGDHLLDARRVDAAVLDQLGQREPGGLAADVVEGADDDHAGRVVHDHVHAGGLLEGADVAALAADDAALHVVGGDVHGADGGVGGVLGGVALDGGRQDLAGLSAPPRSGTSPRAGAAARRSRRPARARGGRAAASRPARGSGRRARAVVRFLADQLVEFLGFFSRAPCVRRASSGRARQPCPS